MRTNAIDINMVIEIVDSFIKGYTYSIVDNSENPMPGFKGPTWGDIENIIDTKKEGYLVNKKQLTRITNAFADIVHFYLVADKSVNTLKTIASSSKNKNDFIDKCFFNLIIEDSQIFEIKCKDKFLEARITSKLGPLPRFVDVNLS